MSTYISYRPLDVSPSMARLELSLSLNPLVDLLYDHIPSLINDDTQTGPNGLSTEYSFIRWAGLGERVPKP